jgi:hypothetical protein
MPLGTNGILECKFLPKYAHRTLGTDGKEAVVIPFDPKMSNHLLKLLFRFARAQEEASFGATPFSKSYHCCDQNAVFLL